MHVKEVKGILSAHNGMNLYRGCTHGCIYCDSRSKCYHIEHDFCDIEVKSNSLTLLESALKRKRKKCMIHTGSMCDPYLHLEKELNYSRRAAELVLKYGFGLTVLTKSDLVLRDIDLLERINNRTRCVVQLTLTTFDENLCKIVEPNVATTKRRVEVLCEFAKRGIPTMVWLGPILPYVNDSTENMMGILNYIKQADVKAVMFFGAGVTLREGNREYFYQQLDKHFPTLSDKYSREFGFAYEINSPQTPALNKLVYDFCNQNGILCGIENVFKYRSEFPQKEFQQSIFD